MLTEKYSTYPEYAKGYGDASRLDACNPPTDYIFRKKAYLRGYRLGIENWNRYKYFSLID